MVPTRLRALVPSSRALLPLLTLLIAESPRAFGDTIDDPANTIMALTNGSQFPGAVGKVDKAGVRFKLRGAAREVVQPWATIRVIRTRRADYLPQPEAGTVSRVNAPPDAAGVLPRILGPVAAVKVTLADGKTVSGTLLLLVPGELAFAVAGEDIATTVAAKLVRSVAVGNETYGCNAVTGQLEKLRPPGVIDDPANTVIALTDGRQVPGTVVGFGRDGTHFKPTGAAVAVVPWDTIRVLRTRTADYSPQAAKLTFRRDRAAGGPRFFGPIAATLRLVDGDAGSGKLVLLVSDELAFAASGKDFATTYRANLVKSVTFGADHYGYDPGTGQFKKLPLPPSSGGDNLVRDKKDDQEHKKGEGASPSKWWYSLPGLPLLALVYWCLRAIAFAIIGAIVCGLIGWAVAGPAGAGVGTLVGIAGGLIAVTNEMKKKGLSHNFTQVQNNDDYGFGD